MFKRSVALALWTYFGWYLGGMVAVFTGLPSALGPAVGIATAVVGIVGWRRLSTRGARAVSTAGRAELAA
jgi:hypothetical protein